MASQDLSNVNPGELRNFLDSFDGILCDCDGVICVSFNPITGAKDGIETLKKFGKKIRVASNNCTQTLENFEKILKKQGVDVGKEDVIIPTAAVISYLKRIKFDKKVFVSGFSAMKREFVEAGFQLADYGPESVEETVEGILSQVQDDLDVGAVVFNFDVNLNYIRLEKASTYVKRPDVLFIVTGTDLGIPISKDRVVMGFGYFQNAVQDVTGRAPLNFGKPGKHYNDYILERYKIEPERTLFIGDTFSDMEFARDCGYQKLMVLSGMVKKRDLNGCRDESLLPKYYVHSLAELHEIISDKL